MPRRNKRTDKKKQYKKQQKRKNKQKMLNNNKNQPKEKPVVRAETVITSIGALTGRSATKKVHGAHLANAGWSLERENKHSVYSRHIRTYDAHGNPGSRRQIITIAKTPSSHRYYKNSLAELLRRDAVLIAAARKRA
jgi:hypothetical protein